ncbi:MAG TPA: hypothetical protein VG897_16180, partial [Terriglobales bacterium]|nr:hypothetical protein [Terriglobales bacterium]
MKRSVIGALACGVFAILVGACAGPIGSKAVSRSLITDGTAFTAGQNPFIFNSSVYNSNPSIPRNSSDPAAVWAPTPQGNKLLMVTSSDMNQTVPAGSNYYPMSKTYLYVLDPNTTGNNNWRDFGAVVSEGDIPWTNHTAGSQPLNLWAPDIDFRTVNNVTTYYIFVPDVDQATGNQKIAVFARSNDPFGSFSGGYKDYVHIVNTDNTEAPYSYDPGVFHLHTGGEISDYYLAYCDGQYSNTPGAGGRAALAHFVDDGHGGLTKATNLGRFTFNGLPGQPNGSVPNFYMEGPDMNVVYGTGDRQQPMIVLQFAAKFDGGKQEYIGVAYKTQSSFAADPVNNWNFGGWIQQQIDPAAKQNPPQAAQWTNHATIAPVQLAGGAMKYYYMYQYSKGGYTVGNPSIGQMRQVSMRELHFNTDLTIQGVGTGSYQYLDDQPYPFDGIAYTAQTANVEPGTNKTRFRIYFNNPTDTSVTGWSALYYFRSENGKIPAFSGQIVPDVGSMLVRFGTDVWAIQFDATTATMAGRYQNPNWGQFPSAGLGYEYTISNSDGSAWNESN